VRVVLFGATGMIGRGVLRECLLDPDVEYALLSRLSAGHGERGIDWESPWRSERGLRRVACGGWISSRSLCSLPFAWRVVGAMDRRQAAMRMRDTG
jgi:hypothetical protein